MIGLLALALVIAVQDDTLERYTDEPEQGMYRSVEVKREGNAVTYALGVSLPNASPPPVALAPAVESVIAARKSGDISTVQPNLTKAAAFKSCSFNGCRALPMGNLFGFSEAVDANTPYLMADGRVRIEWMVGDKVKYQSWLSFKGSKISQIITGGAEIKIETETTIVRTPTNG